MHIRILKENKKEKEGRRDCGELGGKLFQVAETEREGNIKR
jgi:hypothetical protein